MGIFFFGIANYSMEPTIFGGFRVIYQIKFVGIEILFIIKFAGITVLFIIKFAGIGILCIFAA
jgi:hypothetical protein